MNDVSACKEIQGLLGRYVDGELGEGDATRVREHLETCDDCAEDARLMEREAELLRGAFAPEGVPEHIGEKVLQRVWRPPMFRYRWIAMAAAAGVVLALGISAVHWLGPEGAALARVTTCSGPLEVCAKGGSWRSLATYSVLRDGDRVRCGEDTPGGMILNANRRFDLDVDTELVFHSSKSGAPFNIDMERGRIRADVARLEHPLNVLTPVANVTVLTEDPGTAGPAEVEVRLTGVAAELGFLDGGGILPAAYAATAERPELEVSVYQGSVLLLDSLGQAATLGPGQRIVVTVNESMPEPSAFDVNSRRPWWPVPGPVVAMSAAPITKPEVPSPATPGDSERPPAAVEQPPDVTPLPPDAVEPAKPAPPRSQGPPAPEGLLARPDIGSVLLAWKPVVFAEPVVEYGIYRRAPGDTEFALVGRFPVREGSTDKYLFLDDGLSMGIEYQYAVAALVRNEQDGSLIDGEMSESVTGKPADFQIFYTGGDKNAVLIIVEKMHDDKPRRQTFVVSAQKSGGASGEIGGPRYIVVEPMDGVRYRALVDFSTGYHLVDIVTRAEGAGGVQRKRSAVVIENDLGFRREIRAQEPAGNGGQAPR